MTISYMCEVLFVERDNNGKIVYSERTERSLDANSEYRRLNGAE
jgi:hypothetical protein